MKRSKNKRIKEKRGFFGKRSIVLAVAIAMVASVAFAIFTTMPVNASPGTTSTIEVSQPVQITNSSYYERGESVIKDSYGKYWLFWGRSEDFTGNYGTGNPDNYHYVIYYKVATTVDGLATATAQAVPNMPSSSDLDEIYQGQTAACEFDGKIYVFATDEGSGSPYEGHIVYWYTSDNGTTWSAEQDTGFTGVHLDVLTHGGKIWLSWNAGSTTNVASYDGTSWSSAYSIQGCTVSGPITRLYEDSNGDMILYFTNGWGITPDRYYFYVYNDGTSSWPTTPSATVQITEPAGVHDCDPLLAQVNGTGDYIFIWAPWNDTASKQWMNYRTASTLTGLNTTTTKWFTYGGYVGTPMVDMWPRALIDGSDVYIFYNTERVFGDETTRGTGNIAMLKWDWNPSHDHFDYIQPAIDEATGTTINVAAGTYNEYLHIVKDNITLQGAGIDQTIIDLDGLIPYWHYAGSSSYASRGGILITPYGQAAAGGNMPGGDPELIEDVTIKDITVKNAGVNPPLYATGTHTGSDDSATLVDSSQSWTPGELVGYWIHNMDDQKSSGGIHAYGQITANTATTVTATLTGGTENDWDNGDHYIITTWEGFYDEDNDGRNDVVGIRVGSGKDVTIENCKVINGGDYGIAFGRARKTDSGTEPPSENPIVRNCIVSDNHETGINVGSTGTVTISNNIVSDNLNPDAPENHAKGICVAGRSNSLLLSGLIANNTVTGNRYYGIEAYRYTDGIVIENNTVTGHNLHYDAAGIFVSTGWGFSKICRNNIVKNNIVTGNIRGIIAYYAWDCTFENNTVSTDSGTYEPGQAAIKIDHAYNITVRNNTVSCDGLGIELTSSDTYNCLVTENTVDGAMFAGVYIRSGAYNNTFTYNEIKNTVSDTFTQYADWGTHDGGDDQSILTDTTKSWTPNAFVGMTVINNDDGSSGIITANTATTITATLTGGTENDWDNGDAYDIVYNETRADGIYLRGGNIYSGGEAGAGNVFHCNNIYGNADYGLENQLTTTVNAECNWWGDISGPYHSSNPSGTGDAVSDNIDFIPWLTAPYPDGYCVGTPDVDDDWNYWTNPPHMWAIPDGNVGIGTDNPQAKLDVNGSVRVQGNNEPYLFFVDANTDRIGIGTNNPAKKLHIYHPTDTSTLRIETGATNKDAAFNLKNPDIMWKFYVSSADYFIIRDVTNGKTTFYTKPNPVNNAIFVGSNSIVINGDGEDADFRVESQDNANMLFVDASTDHVGIGTNNPNATLDVEGTVEAHAFNTGDIFFQKDGKKLWRMFEDENGLYVENLETGKIYTIVSEDMGNNAMALKHLDNSIPGVLWILSLGIIGAMGVAIVMLWKRKDNL